MIYLVYKTTNILNNKIYIGIHKTNDINDGYVGSGTLLKRAIEKHSIDKFKTEIIKIFNNPDDMYNLEQELVNEDFVKRKDTYNITIGGHGGGYDFINQNNLNHKGKTKELFQECGRKSTQILKEKYGIHYHQILSNQLEKGRKKQLEIYGRVGGLIHFHGKHHTKEAKTRIGKANSEHQKGTKNSQYGTCWIFNESLKTSKKIFKKDVDTYLNEGWKKGRKINFDRCTSSKTKTTKSCKKCGEITCKYPNICSKREMINTLIKFFGLNERTLGTKDFYQEYDRVVNHIRTEYEINRLSTIEITKKYNLTSTQRLDSIFKSIGIKPRSYKEALQNYVEKNKGN